VSDRDEALARLLERDLPEGQATEVDRLLAADPEFRREAAALVGLDRLLRFRSYIASDRPDMAVGVMCRIEQGTPDDARRFAEKVSRKCVQPAAPGARPTSRRVARRFGSHNFRRGAARHARAGGRDRTSSWVPAATVAAILLVAATVGYRLTRKDPPTPVGPMPWTARAGSVSGQVTLVRAGAKSALRGTEGLLPGDRLETAGEARAAFAYNDGSLVEINERTTLTLGAAPAAKQLALEEGDAYVNAPPQPAGRPMLLNPGGTDQIEVVGTELAVSVMPREVTVVQVRNGQVLFGSGPNRTAVGAGFGCRASPGRPPGKIEQIPVEEFALWRRAKRPSPEAPPKDQPGTAPTPGTIRPDTGERR